MGENPVDEGLHRSNADPAWQESVYLAWLDPEAGLGGNHRIGNEVNRGRANLWCGVYERSGRRFRRNEEDLPLVALREAGLQAGPQRLFHDGQRLRFVLEDSRCQVDLEIEDEDETFEKLAPGSSGRAVGPPGVIFSQNFHVFGRARGTVTLGGRDARIDAHAWRDHSWGVRRWDSFSSSRSFGGAFGRHLRFRYGSMVGVNGDFFRHGSVLRDGSPAPVRSAQMLVSMDDDSLRCPAAEIRYELGTGETIVVRIETIGGMLGVTRRRFGWESVGDLVVDGEPGGWGFLEVNNNPRNGCEPPSFVLAQGLTNGITLGPQ